MSYYSVKDYTPIAMFTVGQLREYLKISTPSVPKPTKEEKKYVYGIRGIAQLFNCSIPTANRIKASGKIDGVITQIRYKIIVDADLAIDLASRKTGRRR